MFHKLTLTFPGQTGLLSSYDSNKKKKDLKFLMQKVIIALTKVVNSSFYPSDLSFFQVYVQFYKNEVIIFSIQIALQKRNSLRNIPSPNSR